MSYVTVIWSVIAAGSLLLAVMYGGVWILDRRQRASLAFAFEALAIVLSVIVELGLMRSESASEWGEWVRWNQVPVLLRTAALVAFIHFYFRTGRPWLMAATVGTRAIIAIASFVMDPNFNFSRIDSIAHTRFLGEKVTVVGSAVTSPYQWFATLSVALVLVFVIDASLTLWRQGTPEARRKAVVIGGASLLSWGIGVTYTQFMVYQEIRLPVLLSPPYLVMLAAMTFELSRDTLRASRLARELRASQARLDLAASAAGLALWSWDPATNRTWTTRAARDMFGLAADEPFEIERVFPMIDADDAAAVTRVWRHAVVSGAEAETQFRVRLPDGSLRWLLVHGRAERDAANRLLSVQGVLRDITGQHRAREENEELRRELAHAGRISVLGTLSSSLAHELGQPLGAILLNTEAAELLLKRPDPDLNEIRQILAQRPAFLHERIAQQPGIGHRLLTLAKTGVEPDPLRQLARKCLDFLQDDAIIPPDGRREHGQFSKRRRILEPEMHRQQSAERRAADRGVGRAGKGLVGLVDERLEILDEHPAVIVGPAALPILGSGGRRVFVDAMVARVIDADDDDRLDASGENELLRRLVDVPLFAERGRLIEYVLPVVQIEHGIAIGGGLIVARRQVHHDRAVMLEVSRVKILVGSNIPGERVRTLDFDLFRFSHQQPSRPARETRILGRRSKRGNRQPRRWLGGRLADHLLGRRDPLDDLEPGVHAESEHPFIDRKVANLVRADVLHDELSNRLRHHEHFIDALAPLEARAITGIAAFAPEESNLADLRVEAELLHEGNRFRRRFRLCVVERLFRELEVAHRRVARDLRARELLRRRIVLRLAVRADAPHESLRQNQVDGGRHVERLEPHVEQSRHRLGR